MTVNVTLKLVRCLKRCRKVPHSPEQGEKKTPRKTGFSWEFSSLSTTTPRSQWRRRSTSATGWYKENFNQYLSWSIGNVLPQFSFGMLDCGACRVNHTGHASNGFSLSAEINVVMFCLTILLQYFPIIHPKKVFFLVWWSKTKTAACLFS